jgi:hypothetical protein
VFSSNSVGTGELKRESTMEPVCATRVKTTSPLPSSPAKRPIVFGKPDRRGHELLCAEVSRRTDGLENLEPVIRTGEGLYGQPVPIRS